MKKFANIQDALDFAAQNGSRLRFPFNCKCNGFSVRVLSPAMARTVDSHRPTLVIMRTQANALELGYVVSVTAFKDMLRRVSGREQQYTLMAGAEEVTVLCHAGGRNSLFSFPLAHRAPELASGDGEYVLLLEKLKTSDWHRFWTPIETHLLHSAIPSAVWQ